VAADSRQHTGRYSILDTADFCQQEIRTLAAEADYSRSSAVMTAGVAAVVGVFVFVQSVLALLCMR
jgi:hypothetical protein